MSLLPGGLLMRPLLLLLLALLPTIVSVTADTVSLPPTLLINSDPVSYFALYDVSLTYQLQNAQATASFDSSDSTTNTADFLAGKLDAVAISTPLTPEQRTSHPTTTAFPFLATAIAPVYRLDALDIYSPPLVFSRDLLVGIFTGRVRTWNDPAFTALNPSAHLPNTSITVVLPAPGCDTELALAFTRALQLFNNSALSFTPSTSPAWPLSAYADYVLASSHDSVNALAAAVVTTDRSVSFASLAVALSVAAQVGQMRNRAGSVVTASSSSVNFAVVELGTQSLQEFDSSYDTMNLMDASGSSAWPMCVATFFLVDLEVTRETCAGREALVRFLLFMYESSVVHSILNAHEYSSMPDVVLSVLDIVHRLKTQMMCHGSTALPAGTSTDVLLYGSPRLHFMGLLTAVYSLEDTSALYTFRENWSEIAFAQLVDRKIDVAISFPGEISSSRMQLVRDSNELTMLPLLLTSVVLIFNLRITSTVDIATTSIFLTLDMPTAICIYARHITDWRDPHVLQLNPDLVPLLGNSSSSSPTNSTTHITLVRPCGSHHSVYNHMSYTFRAYARRYNTSLLALIDEMDQLPTTLGIYGCVRPIIQAGVYWTPYESTMSSVVHAITGAVGFMQDNQPAGFKYRHDQFAILYPRRDPLSGAVTLHRVMSDPEASLACLDALNLKDPTLAIEDSTSPACYPFVQVVDVMVRAAYSSSWTDTGSCTRGLKSVAMMEWLVSNDLSKATEAQNFVRTSIVPSAKQAFLDALNMSTCDSEPLLYSRPFVWKLNGAIATFAYVGAGLGVLYCAVSLGLIAHFHAHPVIRSASPIFLGTTVVGLLLFFTSCIVWVATPTDVSCGMFMWTLNVGFYLTFGPLFAKAWRIYRIFGRKKLKVVKITNSRLAAAIGVGLVIEMMVLIAWHAISPMQPTLTVQWVGSPPREHDYTQCGVSDAGSSFFKYMIVSKVALLVFGVVMAFATRKVKSTFNESHGIAWSIYNLCFSSGLIILITVLVDAKGDVFTMLLLFLMLWVGLFTTLVLTASKIGLVLRLIKPEDDLAQMSVNSNGYRFPFMSFASISSRTTMQAYVRALEDHLAAAKKHLTSLPSDGMMTARSATMAPGQIGGDEHFDKAAEVATGGGGTNSSMVSMVCERPPPNPLSRMNTFHQVVREAKPSAGLARRHSLGSKASAAAANGLARQQSFGSKPSGAAADGPARRHSLESKPSAAAANGPARRHSLESKASSSSSSVDVGGPRIDSSSAGDDSALSSFSASALSHSAASPALFNAMQSACRASKMAPSASHATASATAAAGAGTVRSFPVSMASVSSAAGGGSAAATVANTAGRL